MGRNKKEDKDKNTTYGISLDPETIKLLKEQSKKENITISKLIQNVMNKHLKNNENMND